MSPEDTHGTVPATAESTYWRLPAGAELLWRSWGDEVVVFNSASGQTHLLDALSGAALKELEDYPKTITHLTNQMAEKFELDPETLSHRLAVICDRFDKLGLAEPMWS